LPLVGGFPFKLGGYSQAPGTPFNLTLSLHGTGRRTFASGRVSFISGRFFPFTGLILHPSE
ncbi:hypothetical protein, partial [Bacillus coahuilensis]|uniref:hypothetical protein n=1 Tax=Bacillus coahuilensis TaxID=408580 RepID=UPI0019D3644D